jgi:phage shock protein E
MKRVLLLVSLSLASPLVAAPNPQIDYDGFASLTRSVGPQRAKRLLSLEKFQDLAATQDAILLDARSADAYAEGHIVGAVNLPFTDFTAESLAAVIGNSKRPILIYCNNNFSNHIRPVALKAAPLSLNVQTFINLTGYGYKNIWELADVVDFNDPQVGWVKPQWVVGLD